MHPLMEEVYGRVLRNETCILLSHKLFWYTCHLETLWNVEYSFIAITPRSTLTKIISTCSGFIVSSNSAIQPLNCLPDVKLNF